MIYDLEISNKSRKNKRATRVHWNFWQLSVKIPIYMKQQRFELIPTGWKKC